MSKADTIQEFVRSYNGSWVGLRIGDKIFPAALNSGRLVTPEHLGLKYNTNPEGAQLQRDINWLTDRDSILRDFPDLGMIQIGATIGYLSTKPYRQWHKGYYPQHVKVWVPNLDDIRALKPEVRFASSHPYVLWQVYNREFWHPTEAVRLLGLGEGVGYPLSRNFGVYTKMDFENPLICYKGSTIGAYEGSEGWVLFDNFKQYTTQFKRETQMEAH